MKKSNLPAVGQLWRNKDHHSSLNVVLVTKVQKDSYHKGYYITMTTLGESPETNFTLYHEVFKNSYRKIR